MKAGQAKKTYDANITGLVVKSAGRPLGAEHGDPGAAANEEGPLIGVGVPVHLAQSTGLNGHMGCGDGLGEREVLRVCDTDLAAASDVRLLVKQLV